MPQISERAVRMPLSPIRKLAPLADEAKSRGVHVYHLNIGQPDIRTPEVALEALRNINRSVLEYSPSQGLASYRKKLAAYYQHINVPVSADDIIVTTGGSEALLYAMLTCLNPGDEVILFEPAYANYLSFATAAGVVVRSVMTRIDDGFALPPVCEIEELINEKTRAILICNPNNPTGYVYTREEMEELSRVVKKHDLFLISDEVYREYVYSSTPFISAGELSGIELNVVIVDSVSKRYSECGIRIGAIVTRNKSVHDAVLKLCMARLSPPLLGQIVAEASLDAPESYMNEVFTEYNERRQCLIEGLNCIPGVLSPTSLGAFYTIARLPVDDAEHFCAWCLSDFEDQGETIMLAPAAGFYVTLGAGRDEVRIAYVLNKNDLRRSLEILAHALEQYPGRKV